MKLANETKQLYREERAKGVRASNALHNAKVLRQFQRLERLGLVRLLWEPDDSWDIDNLLCQCEQKHCETQHQPEIRKMIERDGVWGLVGQYNLEPHKETVPRNYTWSPRGKWINADAVWGFIGLDENGYEPDIMADTIKHLREAIRLRNWERKAVSCPCCAGLGKVLPNRHNIFGV